APHQNPRCCRNCLILLPDTDRPGTQQSYSCKEDVLSLRSLNPTNTSSRALVRVKRR
ncbi:hypothetical protein NPIL_472371, partial [Nephila pilipes]